jgi:Mu-like prophage protein gpG
MAGVHVQGVEQVKRRLRLLGVKSVQATGDATKRVLDRVARQERILLNLGWHPMGTPTGSKPGQPPGRISGHLADEVKVHGPRLVGGLGRPRWEGAVGSSAVYARIQELGGWAGRNHQSYLPPRPHLKPAWRIVRPTARAVYVHELRRAVQEALLR